MRILSTCLLAALLLLPLDSAFADEPWDAPRIAVVWPHDGQGHLTTVDRARSVNVSVWPSLGVRCANKPGPTPLWMARNDEPAAIVRADGQMTVRTADGATYPTLEYANIPLGDPSEPTAQYRFFVLPERSSVSAASNVWVHTAEPRMFPPREVTPTGFSQPSPKEVDVRIQVVQPHDYRRPDVAVPLADATDVDLGVDIFEHGTLKSLPVDTPLAVRNGLDSGIVLFSSQDNANLNFYLGKTGRPTYYSQQITRRVNGQVFPRWIFKNVPVRSEGQYHYLVRVLGNVVTYPTVWTYATDARTLIPNPALTLQWTSGPGVSAAPALTPFCRP